MTDNSNQPPHVLHPKAAQEPHTTPRTGGRPVQVSQRGLLSLVAAFIGIFAFSISLAGVAKLTIDIFTVGFEVAMKGIWAKVIVIGLIYLFGWIICILGVRVFGNLVLPILIKFFSWVVLAWTGVLYIIIIQRLYVQVYDAARFWAYLLMTAAGLLALLGFHLILEGHDLRPFAIPLLVIAMAQLFVILIRYVFTTDAKPEKLVNDLIFFGAMITVSGFMVAHVGILNPVRKLLNQFFDQNSHVIRPES
jgi:hypothetical protein